MPLPGDMDKQESLVWPPTGSSSINNDWTQLFKATWEQLVGRLCSWHCRPILTEWYGSDLGGGATVVNNTFFLGLPWAPPGLYCLRGSQALSWVASKSMVSWTLGVIVRDLQVFNETLVNHVVLRWLWRFLQNEASFNDLWLFIIYAQSATSYCFDGGHPINKSKYKICPWM